MNEKSARLFLGVGLPAVVAAIAYVPILILSGDLPDRFATHFSSSGVPNGSMTPTGLVLTSSLMIGIGLVMTIVVAFVRKPLPEMMVVAFASLGGFLAGLGAGILTGTVITQRNITDWTEASSPWGVVLVAIGLALGAAAVAARLAIALPTADTAGEPGATPVMELGDGEHAVWSGTLRSGVLLWLGLVLLLITAFIAIVAFQWFTTIVLVLSSIAVLSIASLRVRADRIGLHVSYGMLPWPRTEIAVRDIETASVIDVRPSQWGGWGYRGSLKVMKQAAVVLRAGPGIRLDLRNGKVFVVTVDNPETAVALLNAEIKRLAQPA